MKIKSFLKPTKNGLFIFIVFALAFYVIFSTSNLQIFPCKIQPVVLNPPPYEESMCGLGLGMFANIGSRIIYTPLAYAIGIIFILIIPYIIGCFISVLIGKRK